MRGRETVRVDRGAVASTINVARGLLAHSQHAVASIQSVSKSASIISSIVVVSMQKGEFEGIRAKTYG